jgi:hypothetical protein
MDKIQIDREEYLAWIIRTRLENASINELYNFELRVNMMRPRKLFWQIKQEEARKQARVLEAA